MNTLWRKVPVTGLTEEHVGGRVEWEDESLLARIDPTSHATQPQTTKKPLTLERQLEERLRKT